MPLKDGVFRFGLPLSAGFSDYFTFPNWFAGEAEDFLARTVRCGIFCEVAVSTMLQWSGLDLVEMSWAFDLRWGAGREGSLPDSVAGLVQYFRDNPGIIGVHPVKTSRFVDGS